MFAGNTWAGLFGKPSINVVPVVAVPTLTEKPLNPVSPVTPVVTDWTHWWKPAHKAYCCKTQGVGCTDDVGAGAMYTVSVMEGTNSGESFFFFS